MLNRWKLKRWWTPHTLKHSVSKNKTSRLSEIGISVIHAGKNYCHTQLRFHKSSVIHWWQMIMVANDNDSDNITWYVMNWCHELWAHYIKLFVQLSGRRPQVWKHMTCLSNCNHFLTASTRASPTRAAKPFRWHLFPAKSILWHFYSVRKINAFKAGHWTVATRKARLAVCDPLP